MDSTVVSSCWNPASLPAGLLLLAVVMVLLAHAYLSIYRSKLPPGPPAWPIIGNLHLLGQMPHQNLAQLSKQYGPIFYLRLGSMPAVVVSSASLAKEFLVTNDKNFANRPPLEISKRLLYGNDNGVMFTRYGPQWREMRKLCSLELFTSKRLQDFEHVRMEEVAVMLQALENQSQGERRAINIGKLIGTMVINITSRMLLTKRLFESGEGGASLKDLIHEMSTVMTPVRGDFIPYLGWLDSKAKSRMDHLHSRIDEFLERVLAERERDCQKNPTAAPNDFLDALLSSNFISENQGLRKAHLKGTLLDVFAAGIDTTAITVEWAMAELLRSRLTLIKLRDEVDAVVGRKRRVEESDLPNLTYLKAVIKETLRLHPPAPLLVPHVSTEACKVAGYTLPENTLLFVNAWAIARDPTTWEKPEEFWPDRFETMDIDLRGQHFELLPFGSGRRICPGTALALSEVELTVSNLVHSFDWELPYGQTPENLDMAEKSGLTVCKAEPLLAIPIPRRADN